MYEQVKTGPLYDEVVQWISTYRSLTARMGGARYSTQKKLDNTLERLGERIDERLNELTDQELSALSCWKSSILPNTVELDRQALMEMPYCSIRLIQRWEEVYDEDQQQQAQQETPDPVRDEKLKQQLAAFLRLDDDG
jgi:hypothetical protein